MSRVLDLNLFTKASNLNKIIRPYMLSRKPYNGILGIKSKYQGSSITNVDDLIRQGQATARSNSFNSGSTITPGGVIGSTLAFLAPILLPIIISKAVSAIKKSKNKNDDKLLPVIQNSNLNKILINEVQDKITDSIKNKITDKISTQINDKSKSILDRVIGSGISII